MTNNIITKFELYDKVFAAIQSYLKSAVTLGPLYPLSKLTFHAVEILRWFYNHPKPF